MIQRQQTLWLILAAVASFLSFQFPFYTGQTATLTQELDGGSNFFLLIVTGASVLLAAITIFIYKNRKTQFKLAVAGVFLSILLFVLYFLEIRTYVKGTLSLTSIFILAILVGYFFAAKGIWKDEKLIKNLDKLR